MISAKIDVTILRWVGFLIRIIHGGFYEEGRQVSGSVGAFSPGGYGNLEWRGVHQWVQKSKFSPYHLEWRGVSTCDRKKSEIEGRVNGVVVATCVNARATAPGKKKTMSASRSLREAANTVQIQIHAAADALENQGWYYPRSNYNKR